MDPGSTILRSCADSVEGGLGVLIDGGPHVGGVGWCLVAGYLLHDDHHTSAVGCRLHTHFLAANQLIVAERVAGLQVIGFCAVCLLVPLAHEAGSSSIDQPLKVGRHGGSSQRENEQAEEKSGVILFLYC